MKTVEKKILVCDSSDLFYMGLDNALKKHSAKFSEELSLLALARNTVEACAAIAEQASEIALLVLDSKLPGGAFGFLQQVKTSYPDIKVLMLSADSESETARNAFLGGADGYCAKAVTSEKLIAALNALLRGAVWLDASISSEFKALLETVLPVPGKSSLADAIDLSPREKEVLGLLVEGLSNAEIAALLFLSVDTVKTHIRHIYEKLCVNKRTEAIMEAMRRGLVPAA